MGKTSDWKIVATEGSTIDERTISAQWIKDMAEQYSLNEYVALIWPEHSRSSWGPYDGKNWGFVSELKAAKKDGKLRLYAKLTPNKYLLQANSDGQKLFSSIEPKENYAGSGKCYLAGLAVTDSPASTGTEMLKFHKVEQTVSDLEPLDVSECFSSSPVQSRLQRLEQWVFGKQDTQQTDTDNEPEDTDVTKEELAAELAKQLQPFSEKLGTLETKVNAFSQQEAGDNSQGDGDQPNADQGQGTEPQGGQQPAQFNAEQLSKAFSDAINPVVEKLDGLENKFNALTQEAPGQRPDGTGGGESAPNLV